MLPQIFKLGSRLIHTMEVVIVLSGGVIIVIFMKINSFLNKIKRIFLNLFKKNN